MTYQSHLSKWKGSIFLAASFMYVIIFIFFGIDFTDTFYNLNLIRAYNRSTLTLLTSLIGSSWLKIFGDSVISFRVLNLILLNLALSLPFIFLVPNKKKSEKLAVLGIAIILLNNFNVNIYNYDTTTFFFLSIALVLVTKYYYTGEKHYLFLNGIVSLLIVLARIPNIVFLPYCVFLFTLFEYSRSTDNNKAFTSSVRIIVFYGAVMFGIVTIALVLLFSDAQSYMQNILAIFSRIDPSHSLKSMAIRYLSHSVKIFQYTAVIVLIALIEKRIYALPRLSKIIAGTLLVLIILLFLRFEIRINNYNYYLSFLISAGTLLLIIRYAIVHSGKFRWESFVLCLVFFGFSLITSVGSNTGLLKISSISLSYLPLIVTDDLLSKISKFRINFIIIPIVLIFVIYSKMFSTYEDRPVIKLNCPIQNYQLHYVYTTKERCEFIEKVTASIAEEQKKDQSLLLFGKVSHIFYYLTRIPILQQGSFWMSPNDPNQLRLFDKVIKLKRPIIFLLDSYPEETALIDSSQKSGNTLFEKYLLSINYQMTTKNGFSIFHPL